MGDIRAHLLVIGAVLTLGLSPARGQLSVAPGTVFQVEALSFTGSPPEGDWQMYSTGRQAALSAGMQGVFSAGGPLALQVELLVTRRRTRRRLFYTACPPNAYCAPQTQRSRIDYLQLPLMGVVAIPVAEPLTVRLLAGPAAGVKLAESTAGPLATDEAFHRFTLSGRAGAGVAWQFSQWASLTTSLRYAVSIRAVGRGIYEGRFRGGGLSAGLRF